MIKEVTEWDNNPREMWVWDDDITHKTKAKVVYIYDNDKAVYHVIAIAIAECTTDTLIVNMYKHCAEISKTYEIEYSIIKTGTIEIEAHSNKEAVEKFNNMQLDEIYTCSRVTDSTLDNYSIIEKGNK